jgi:hypothetical protein
LRRAVVFLDEKIGSIVGRTMIIALLERRAFPVKGPERKIGQKYAVSDLHFNVSAEAAFMALPI